MRRALIAPALLALGLASMPMAAQADQPRSVKQEERLAKMLAGRTAGKPVDCINQQQIRGSTVLDRTAIVYEMNNGTYYVNRPKSGANFLNDNLLLVTSTQINRLCSVDIVRLVDSGSGMSMG